MAVERLRFGVAGCGVIGPIHVEALASLADAELCAVANLVAAPAEKVASKYGARVYTDIGEMLAHERLDVVTICTPSGLHGVHACQAMEAGCHVIVEKPMEINLAAIDTMLRVQRERGVKLAVISQRRFEPDVQRVRALIDEDAFGRLVLGNAMIPWWRSQAYYDSGDWRGTWELDGGGVLMNQAIHTIDLLQWMMGPVKSVKAVTDTLVHSMATEDVATAAVRFVSGAVGTISATTGAYPGLATRLELLGNQGSVVMESERISYLYLAREETSVVGDYGSGVRTGQVAAGRSAASDPAALAWQAHASQIADMIAAIRADRTPLVDGEAARRPVEVILGIYESARTGREVVLA